MFQPPPQDTLETTLHGTALAAAALWLQALVALFVPCRPLPERGEYRLQSEDGSMTVPHSATTGVAEAYSNSAGDPVGSVLSLGRAAVQSMQPEAAETNELTQLITPLVLGKLSCVCPLHDCNTSGLAMVKAVAFVARGVSCYHKMLTTWSLLHGNVYC